MTLDKLTESINPVRKAGEILGRLESQGKTSTEVDRIVSGEDEIYPGSYISEELMPESFREGYREGMEEASESIRYTDLTETDGEHDFLYAGGD